MRLIASAWQRQVVGPLVADVEVELAVRLGVHRVRRPAPSKRAVRNSSRQLYAARTCHPSFS